jgi:osmotically-inducible protein OsmY
MFKNCRAEQQIRVLLVAVFAFTVLAHESLAQKSFGKTMYVSYSEELVSAMPGRFGFQEEALSDDEIVDAIKQKLELEQIQMGDIQVFATEGVVTLTGKAKSLAKKIAINRVAYAIRSVHGVVNQIEIPASNLSDDTTADAIRQILASNPATDDLGVTVSVKDGNVTLTGAVGSYSSRELVEDVVSLVKGVRSIDSQIEVTLDSTRSDKQIYEEISNRLDSDVWINEKKLKLNVSEGSVIITGSVPSVWAKLRIEALAVTTGAKEIDVDGIDIDSSLEQFPKKTIKTRSDQQIRESLMQALELDPRVEAIQIVASIKSGFVELSGSVSDWQAKRAAVETARNVYGVVDVTDNIRVKPVIVLSDEEIKNRLATAWSNTAMLDDSSVEFEVDSGKVTLSGTVVSFYQLRLAQEIAESISGIAEISNEIQVAKADEPVADKDIELSLNRLMRWSPYLDISILKFKVNDRVVTFNGYVRDYQSFELAREFAIQAGAKFVKTDKVQLMK